MSAAPPPWVSSYDTGVPAGIEPPTQSLVHMVEDTVERYAELVALEFFGARTTYGELGEQIDRVAEGLRRLGVAPGHPVAIILPNSPQYVVAFHAVLRLGAIAVAHDPESAARELRHRFEDHEARVVLAWDRVVPAVAALPADLEIAHIVSVDVVAAMPWVRRAAMRLPSRGARAARERLTGRGAGATTTWGQLLDSPLVAADHPRPDASDLAVLEYTSGTTRRPRGAMLTHANLRANAMQAWAWMHGAEPGEEVVYAVLPLHHALGLTLHLTLAMLTGSRLVLFPSVDVDLVLSAVRRSPPTVLCAVPPVFERLAIEATRRGTDLRTIRFALSGAVVLPEQVATRWEAVAGGRLVEGYVLTEASSVALCNPFGPARRPGTVGVPLPGTQIKVVDPDAPTQEVPAGRPGELLIRGPQVFQGYWNDPDASRDALLVDGWLRTGDLVTVDGDHFVTVLDRRTDIIGTDGSTVSPSAVEGTLSAHPAVSEAAVVGVGRPGAEEQVVAAVVLVPGASLDEEALLQHCRERLSPHQVPRRIVAVGDVPRSVLGRVLRQVVRTRVVDALGPVPDLPD